MTVRSAHPTSTPARRARWTFVVAFAALALLATSCSNDEKTSVSQEGDDAPAETTTTGDDHGDMHHDEAAGHEDGHEDGHGHEDESGDDKGLALLVNGHQHESGIVEVDAETQTALDAQLAQTQVLVEKYPTLADAEAAGYKQAGPFSPGLGIHFSPPEYHFNADGIIDDDDLPWPMLIFDGTEPDAKLAGFMYLAYGGTAVPEGFIGPNDHWHYHEKVCIVYGADGEIDTPFGADLEGVTTEMCTEAGGVFIEFTGYMVHVWTVPGYESERGVFSEINPAITCPDGTYFTIAIEELGTKDSTCRGLA